MYWRAESMRIGGNHSITQWQIGVTTGRFDYARF
jgi:hypothetical protein